MKINFKVTTRCPADCLCCQERLANFEMFNNEEVEISKIFERILALFKAKGDKENHLSITGGEPTLVLDLPKYVKKMVENNISVGIDTNGWNITEEWLNTMEKAGLKYILLSVYSLKKHTYEFLRGSDNGELFERMKNAITILKRYKEEGGCIEVRLQTVLMKPNYKELPDILELSILSGFDTLSTAYYIALDADERLLMDQNDIKIFIDKIETEMISIIKRYLPDNSLVEKNINKIYSFFMFDSVSLENIARGKYRENNCGERNRVAIYPNGVVAPCLGFDYYMDEKNMLNIMADNTLDVLSKFQDFWNKDYVMCKRCSSGYQIWLELS